MPAVAAVGHTWSTRECSLSERALVQQAFTRTAWVATHMAPGTGSARDTLTTAPLHS